jgi:hypothetical protein
LAFAQNYRLRERPRELAGVVDVCNVAACGGNNVGVAPRRSVVLSLRGERAGRRVVADRDILPIKIRVVRVAKSVASRAALSFVAAAFA